MTTSELVARIAAWLGTGGSYVVWRWPLHYYLAERREYLKIVGLTRRPDETSQRRTGGHPNFTVETISGPG
jgi:hypothetical protein